VIVFCQFCGYYLQIILKEAVMTSGYSIQDYVDVVKQGISKKVKDGRPKKVVIVGAGLTGLAAGYELLQAGHEPIILEAQHRIGGRIYTLREPFAQGLYADAGAMIEAGASHMWHDNPYAGGAFALFDPRQQTLLYDDIVKPEGRIHFAGEHASLYHAWIQGAFESGLRAAIAVHQAK
jgi:monoamine oxidase